MEKLIVTLLALVLAFSGVYAEENGTADVPVSEIERPGYECVMGEDGSVTITLPANSTTGYEWTAFVLGGDSAEIDDTKTGYVSDPNPEMMDGVGGTYYLVLKPVQPGESIIRLTYSRGWMNEIAEEIILLADVNDEMQMEVRDVTKEGVMEGTVLEVNADDRTVVLMIEGIGDAIVTIPADMEMPMAEEVIRIYTNGIMTMSLPPLMNALAWETVPSDLARDME